MNVLFDEGLVDPELGGVAEHVNGLDEVRALATEFPPEAVAAHCGVAAEEIRAVAREIAAAPSAAVYGRIGTSTVEFGTLGSWLVDVINILTGNLDRPGGAMFPLSPTASAPRPPKPGRGFRTGRWHSRVSGYPEALSELPAAALPEEIDTPGEGQVKALITIAGNPVLSAPDGERLSRALDGIGFMLSVDPYLNETTRHADVILPPPPPSQSAHFDFALNNVSVRNNARYSPPVLPLADGRPDEPEILSRLALILYGAGPDARSRPGRRAGHRHHAGQGDRRSRLAGRGPGGRRADRHAGSRTRLRAAPRHDAAPRTVRRRLRRQAGRAHPRAAQERPARHRFRAAAAPRARGACGPASGKIELAPDALVADAARLRDSLDRSAEGFVLIGRRHLRSNNSWMHNLPALAGGTNRCTLQIHPDDAADLGLTDTARVKGPGGELVAPVEVTDGHPPRRRFPAARLGSRPQRHQAGGRRRPARRERQPAQRR